METWIVVDTGPSDDTHKRINFPSVGMALDYMDQMPYVVRSVSLDIVQAMIRRGDGRNEHERDD